MGPHPGAPQHGQHLDEVVFNRVAGGSGSRSDPQLIEDGSDMRVDRRQTHHQAFGHLRISQPLSQQAQHFHLPSRQSRGRTGGLLRRS